ncbi:TPA: hypothetical protein ACN7U5_003047 [Klebsiella pneumoniae]
MTGITELAQSLKAAAVRVIKNYDSEWFEAGHQICTVHKSKINLISLANPVSVLALVEELEKAQTKADVYDMLRDDYGLREKGVGLADFVDWQAKRIAELESRTVTVKLPESFKLAKSSSGLRYYYADEVDAALTDAGIKVEAE